MKKSLLEIVRIFKITTLKDLQDLGSINVGSNHKSKEEIVNRVCKDAADARAFGEFLLHCISHIAEGGSIESYLHARIDEITQSSNLCTPDKNRLRGMLNRLSEETVNLD